MRGYANGRCLAETKDDARNERWAANLSIVTQRERHLNNKRVAYLTGGGSPTRASQAHAERTGAASRPATVQLN